MGRAPIVASLVLVAACGIGAVGTASPSEMNALPDADVGVAKPDGGGDAATCRSITTGMPGSLVAPRVAAAPQIDGDLSEWQSCFVRLDESTASAMETYGPGPRPSGEFSIAHDGTKVYFAARVTGIAPLGDEAEKLWLNDCVEFQFDGDGVTEEGYGLDARRFMIDHAGRLFVSRGGGGRVDAPGARAAARVEPDGVTYTVELEVTPATVGQTSFPNVLGFDFAITDGDGSDTIAHMVWYQKCRKDTGCGCSNGGDAPWCDSRQFGSMMLAP